MKGYYDLVKEVSVRFVLGGTAVVLCYIVSIYSVKFIGGIFAAFPAVMAASVSMAGIRDGDEEAADVARGAISGMVGCAACVMAALYLIRLFSSWPLGLACSVGIWFTVAVIVNRAWGQKTRKRQTPHTTSG